MRVLFLCTGNYYRSRLAEELLRSFSASKRVNIISDSSGLGIIPNPINIGPIRCEALDYLDKCGIKSKAADRFPKKCTKSDIEDSDIIIGMNEREHKHMIDDQFPGITGNRVRYWHVPDMEEDPDLKSPDLIKRNVMALIEEILAG